MNEKRTYRMSSDLNVQRSCEITHAVTLNPCRWPATHRCTADWNARVCAFHAKVCDANGFVPVPLPDTVIE